MWDDRHGYENKMAEDEWSGQNNHTSNNWTTYDANSGWNEGYTAPTTYDNQPVQPRAAPTPSKKSQKQHKPAAPPQRKAEPAPPAKDGFSMFVTESSTSFPTWED